MVEEEEEEDEEKCRCHFELVRIVHDLTHARTSSSAIMAAAAAGGRDAIVLKSCSLKAGWAGSWVRESVRAINASPLTCTGDWLASETGGEEGGGEEMAEEDDDEL